MNYIIFSKLLAKNVENRLGSKKGAEELKNHPWFKSVDWEKIYKKEIATPFQPKISGKMSVDNFDQEYTNESMFF